MKPLIKAIRPASFKQKQSLEDLRAGRHTAQLDPVLINTGCSFAMKCTQGTDTGNIRGMLEGMKKATGPTDSETAPLKSKAGEFITGGDKQMERWVECYVEIYGIENKVTEIALNTVPQLTGKVRCRTNTERVGKGISCLTSGNAPESI